MLFIASRTSRRVLEQHRTLLTGCATRVLRVTDEQRFSFGESPRNGVSSPEPSTWAPVIVPLTSAAGQGSLSTVILFGDKQVTRAYHGQPSNTHICKASSAQRAIVSLSVAISFAAHSSTMCCVMRGARPGSLASRAKFAHTCLKAVRHSPVIKTACAGVTDEPCHSVSALVNSESP